MHYKYYKRNTPIATLIKRYVNKKSGKVVDSRVEIQRRFDYLDWKDQKKILSAFLESGKTDRQWAYLKLLDLWDEVFEPKVKELWEQLHEEQCAWVVIRNFPVEYLTQNIATFTGKRDYYFICLRLAWDKTFVIDKDKLSYKDYLAVLYHSGRKIDSDEAEKILYETVYRVCTTCFPDYVTWILDKYADTSVGSIISPIHFNPISIVVYYLRNLNCNFVVRRFEDWNEVVQQKIAESPEFKKMLEDGITGDDYLRCMMKVSRLYAYLSLPVRYKKRTDPSIIDVLNPKDEHIYVPEYDQKLLELQHHGKRADTITLKKMMKKNPNIKDLIGGLELEVRS